MALMGFATGALSDVMRRREQRKLEEAQALKEERLAAIRAEERGEDRAFTREQFAAQQEAMNTRDERNYEQQKEFFGMQTEVGDKRDERNFAQQRQLAAEQRSHSEKMLNTRLSAGVDDSGRANPRAPKPQNYVNEKTGKVVTFDVNDHTQVEALKEWQRTQPVKPYYASSGKGAGKPAPPASPQATASPAPQSFARDYVKYPVTGRPPK